MTKKELELVGQMLDVAADQFSNHGCNDFKMPNTDENWAFIEAMQAGLPPEDCDKRPAQGDPIYTMDWAVMRYLADKAREESKS